MPRLAKDNKEKKNTDRTRTHFEGALPVPFAATGAGDDALLSQVQSLRRGVATDSGAATLVAAGKLGAAPSVCPLHDGGPDAHLGLRSAAGLGLCLVVFCFVPATVHRRWSLVGWLDSAGRRGRFACVPASVLRSRWCRWWRMAGCWPNGQGERVESALFLLPVSLTTTPYYRLY